MVHADSLGVTTQVSTPSAAIPASSTDNMAFARHALADAVFGGRFAAINDFSAEFVTRHHWDRHGRGGPFVPFPDMHIRPADRGFSDLDEYFVRTRFRHGDPIHPEPLFGVGFDQSFHQVGHWINPISRPTSTKASMAWSSSARLWAADIALMTDDIGRVPWLISHSRRAMSIIRQNIAISLVTKAAFVVATAFGMASMWGAIAADVGVSLLVVANALRLLNGHRAESPPQSGDRVSDRLTEGALAHGH